MLESGSCWCGAGGVEVSGNWQSGGDRCRHCSAAGRRGPSRGTGGCAVGDHPVSPHSRAQGGKKGPLLGFVPSSPRLPFFGDSLELPPTSTCPCFCPTSPTCSYLFILVFHKCSNFLGDFDLRKVPLGRLQGLWEQGKSSSPRKVPHFYTGKLLWRSNESRVVKVSQEE